MWGVCWGCGECAGGGYIQMLVLVALDEPVCTYLCAYKLKCVSSCLLCREMERAYDELMQAEREVITARGHQPHVSTWSL